MRYLLFLCLFFIPLGVSAEVISWASSGTDPISFGRDGGDTVRIAQSFTPSADTSAVNASLRLGRSASNSRNIVVSVQADTGSNAPDGTPLGSVNISESGLVTSDSNCADAVDTNTGEITGLLLSAATKYWLVLDTDSLVPYASGVPFACGGAFATAARYYDTSWHDWTSKGILYDITLTAAGGGSVDIGGATSTLEQAQSNLAQAFWLYLACFFGVVWLLRKH